MRMLAAVASVGVVEPDAPAVPSTEPPPHAATPRTRPKVEAMTTSGLDNFFIPPRVSGKRLLQ
jgi:hypothetical protein